MTPPRSDPSPAANGPAPSPCWPPGLPRHLRIEDDANLSQVLQATAARFADKPFVLFGGRAVTYADFHDQAERLAGWLQQACKVQTGDRVLLCMQNCPQWMIAFHGILRANAVVVPVSPMNGEHELRHLVHDSGAVVTIVAQEVYRRMQHWVEAMPMSTALQRTLIATYSDFAASALPESMRETRDAGLSGPHTTAWQDAIEAGCRPGPLTARADDVCLLPYTSGTTAQPRGCIHTHRSVLATQIGGAAWFDCSPDSVVLSVLPLFHVTGMTGGMNNPLQAGATVVLLPRWDRTAALQSIVRDRISHWQAISTMVIDFLAQPGLEQADLSSLRCIRGGGAAMPEAVASRLRQLTGLDYIEGYGLTETMAATHINPPHRPRAQCLGIAVFDVDARLIDPVTLQPVAQGEVGEIVMRGPQVMQGYWNDPQATRDAFVDLGGQRFLRTGDLARIDAEGYFFMVDRLKRIINTSGFKVSPVEVESMLLHHPDVVEACVIAVPDAYRGQAVKALVVLRPGAPADMAQIRHWAGQRLAAFKVPRHIESVDSLPRLASGKVPWRQLQEQQALRAGALRDE